MLDPLVLRIISIGFALLFIPAAVHKFANRDQFASILRAYEIMPQGLTEIVARIIPLFEISLGLAWLLSGTMNVPVATIALMTAILLALYTSGIAINMARGRSYIDCGCSFSTTITKTENDAMVQHLSTGLLARNILLITVALVAVFPSSIREFVIIDYFNLLTATIALVLLFGAFNQLLINKNAINAWRKPRG